MFFIFAVFLLISHSSYASQAQRPPKKQIVAEQAALNTLFSGSIFNDDTGDLQRNQLRAEKDKAFYALFTNKDASFMNRKDEHGNPPLLRAVQGIEIEVYGANQEDISSERWDAPHEWITFLLEHGALINEQNNQGKTALHLAAEAGNEQLLELMLRYHPDTQIRDSHGKRAIDYLQPSDTDTEESKKTKLTMLTLLENYNEQQCKVTKALLQAETNIPQRIDSIIAEYVTTSPSKNKRKN